MNLYIESHTTSKKSNKRWIKIFFLLFLPSKTKTNTQRQLTIVISFGCGKLTFSPYSLTVTE